MHRELEQFLTQFIPEIARKTKQFNQAYWLVATTGHSDAADLQAELDTELRVLLSNREVYEKLLKWDREVQDPLLKRQLNVLIRTFKQNLIPRELLEKISQKEAALAQVYNHFRPTFEGKKITENEIREILKNEENPERRLKAWEASKQIGEAMAPKILELVELRNQVAKTMGYSDFFEMQLELQEVDSKWLRATLDDLASRSDGVYTEMLETILEQQAKRFHVTKDQLGPWAWGDPFCQEDPLGCQELDSLVEGVDILKATREFYERMGIDVSSVFDKSDMYERPGKNQHAFCINIDRNQDVRTLNNVQPSIKWLDTLLHELGHAIYELEFDQKLPWLLREPPHMITTEAMALLAGRQAYRFEALCKLLGDSKEKEALMRKADASQRRRQLIFSRWVLVMTAFESKLYQNPKQDLNQLWWKLVHQYQKLPIPKNREGKWDWAAKVHIGLSPVYYFSYLLGEMFASAIEEALEKAHGSKDLDSSKAGEFLKTKLFFPGNRMNWNDLIEHVTTEKLSADAWLKQFGCVNSACKT